MKQRNRLCGFTLIELLVVVTIVGILAAIAFPSFLEQIRKARRADSQAVTFELAQLMERIYSENGTYYTGAAGKLPALTGAAAVFPNKSPIDGADRFYTLTLVDPNNDDDATEDYRIQALPVNQQAGDRCGTLTLTNTGARGINGADAGVTVDDCW